MRTDQETTSHYERFEEIMIIVPFIIIPTRKIARIRYPTASLKLSARCNSSLLSSVAHVHPYVSPARVR